MGLNVQFMDWLLPSNVCIDSAAIVSHATCIRCYSRVAFFLEYVLDHKHEIKLVSEVWWSMQRFLSPCAMVDPRIGAPLMLAFNSSHARA